MGITERREREKNERRRMILNSTRELILLHGVEHVSMEDIARKAELSKATIYLYFPGKEMIFNEICEESARVFLEHFKPFVESGYTGLKALKHLWSCYVSQFGNSNEMIIVFKIHNFLTPGRPFVSFDGQSPNVVAILQAMKAIIDQCKSEGVFDPGLNSDMAAGLLLSLFSGFVDKAARMLAEESISELNRNVIIEEMTKSFQIILRGFAKQGIDLSCLDISVM
jgi:AcrR family transcriptional regulator